MMGDSAEVKDCSYQQEGGGQPQCAHPPAAPRFLLPSDVLENVLLFLPVIQLLRCSRTSRFFSRASAASLHSALCSPDPGANAWNCGTHGHCCSCGFDYYTINGGDVIDASRSRDRGKGNVSSGGGGTGEGLDPAYGKPYLDLRAAEDSLDGPSLVGVLRRVFEQPSKESKSNSAAAGVGRNGACLGENSCRGNNCTARDTPGRHTTLQGLAVRSAAIQTEAMRQVLDVYGEGLKLLDLAGCRGLDNELMVASIRQRCKRLVALDLSGPFGEGTARPSLCANARWSLLDSGSLRGWDADTNRLQSCHLVSLVHAVGSGLLYLRLRDRPDVVDHSVEAIALSCTQLRELDIGTGSKMSESGKITGQAISSLSAAPLARSLSSLGLRNRDAIGHVHLWALGTHFPSLSRLDMAGLVKVDDTVLRDVSSTLSLSHIDLSRAHRVTAAGVSALAIASPELECISLHGINVSDGVVRALCDACPKLRHINLSMTCVTEKSLRLLATKDSLRWVNVRCCPGLLDNDLAGRALVDLESRLSAREHPKDRGKVLGMERPEPQVRGRPPNRSPRPPHAASSNRHYQEDIHGRPSRLSKSAQAVSPSRSFHHPSAPSRGRDDVGDRIEPSFSSNLGAVLTVDASDEGGNEALIQGRAARAGAVEGFDAESSQRGLASSFTPVLARRVKPGTKSSWTRETVPSRAQGNEQVHSDEAADDTADARAEGAPAPIVSPEVAAVEETTEGGPASSTLQTSTPATPSAVLRAPPPPSPPPVAEKAAPSSHDHLLTLLPANVGDLSLDQQHARGRLQRRDRLKSSVRTTTLDSAEPTSGTPGSEQRRDHERGEFTRRRGGVEGSFREAQGREEPFDWDAVPRGGGVGGLRAWKGFCDRSADLVRSVVRELHPCALVEFRAKSDQSFGPPIRKPHHGFLVHTSRWGQAWVEFEVNDQGCIA